MHQGAVIVKERRAEQPRFALRKIIENVGMFGRPIFVVGKHIRIDDQYSVRSREFSGGVVSRAKPGVSWKQDERDVDIKGHRADARFAQKLFSKFGTVGNVQKFIIFDALPTGEQRGLQEQIFGLSVEADN